MSTLAKFSVPCPQCGHGVSVSDALAQEARAENERRLQDAVKQAEAKARASALDASKLQVADLVAQLAEQKKKAEEHQVRELKLLSSQRELEEKSKNIELQILRGVQAEAKRLEVETKRFEDETTKRFQDEARLKEAQHQLQLQSMAKQVDELRRKTDQASQQLQGEALEFCLEDELKASFPMDTIDPVAKGVRGADIKQGVALASGKVVGTILWEAKRTKSWSDSWIDKVKDHQREIGADHAVIVTQAMPKDLGAGQVFRDGVWIVDYKTYQVLATALHVQIRAVAQARAAAAGKGDKMEILYDYSTGVVFKQRVEAMVEIFMSNKEDLEKEKRSFHKAWAARERQNERLALTVASLYGDIRGIVGRSLPMVNLLELDGGDESNNEERFLAEGADAVELDD